MNGSQSEDMTGTPSHHHHASQQSNTSHPLLPSDILNNSTDDKTTSNFLRSYNSLRGNNSGNMGGDGTGSNNALSSASASCQRRIKKGDKNKADNSNKNQPRSESMANFSKRFSILTGKELVFPGSQLNDDSSCLEQENNEGQSNGYDENCPPPVPGHQVVNHGNHSTNSFIRIREKPAPRPHASTPMHQSYSHRLIPPPLPPHAIDLRPSSRLSSPDVLMFMTSNGNNHNHPIPSSPHVRMRESLPPPLPPHHPKLTPQCKQSSLVSLDRRIIPQRNSLSSPGVHPVPSSSSSSHDSVRRSALLRSASSTAAAVAAAAASSGQPHHLHSTLGPNQFLHSSPSQLINQPVPRSLQVSPALTQRSLYAQHIFSQPDPIGSSHPVFCTTSRVSSGGISSSPGDCTPRRSSAIGWVREELLRHHTSRANASSSSSNASNSVLKSATSEFSFCRPDSPLTLPYNKSKSFYGRPISSGGTSSGVLSSNPSLNQFVDGNVPPPPRPPLPKQVSLDSGTGGSSTLFRCSAAATTAAANQGKKSNDSTVHATPVLGSLVSTSSSTASSSSSSGFSSGSNKNKKTAQQNSSSLQRIQRNHSSSRHHQFPGYHHHQQQQLPHQSLCHQPSLPESLSSDSDSQLSIASMPVTLHNSYNNGHPSSSFQHQAQLFRQQQEQVQHNMQYQPQNRPSSYHYEVERTGRTSSAVGFQATSAVASDDEEPDCSTLNNRTADRSRKHRMNRILDKSSMKYSH